MELSKTDIADVIVIGAGLAGTTTSAVLGGQGRRVILIDPRLECPPVFKAEKIDQQQVQLLESLGLLKYLIPISGRVREVRVGYDGHVFKTIPIEQYGLSYSAMVNELRRHLPSTVVSRSARVVGIANSSEVQRVKLSNGDDLASRLVILASGGSRHLYEQLGLRLQVIQRDQSLVFGFDVAPPDLHAFDFDSVTYYSLDPSVRIDYLTLFRFRRVMRANLFVFRSATDPWVREFIQDPERMLHRYLPKLTQVTGQFRVVSKIDSGRVDLYRMDGEPQPGVVAIGDAFQSVCPSTGAGLDKVLTDISVLAECVPRWLATPGMDTEKLAEFYEDPRKISVDSQALRSALYHRRAVIDPRFRWRLRRFLFRLRWKLFAALEFWRRGNKRSSHQVELQSGDDARLQPTLTKEKSPMRSTCEPKNSAQTRVSGLHRRDVPDLSPELSVETGQAYPEEWNNILHQFTDANLCQTWPYASTRWGARNIGHVVLKRGNEIVAAAQIIFIRIPLLSIGVAYVKWGPIWRTHGRTPNSSDFHQMLIALRWLYVDQARLLLRVSPWEFKDSAPQPLFETAGYTLNVEGEQLRTAVLDLSYSMDELRAGLSRHWRYNLKSAENNALEIVEGCTDELIETFMALYKNMRHRKGNADIPTLKYLPQVQSSLPTSLKPRIMICRHDGVAVAGLIVSAMGSRAFAVAAATGMAGLDLRGSYLLQWRMIEWLKSQNIHWYDLARINPNTHPGTTQFKLGLCGKLGTTVGYLGDFEVYESLTSHLLVGAADRLRHALGKIRIGIFDHAPRWRVATP